MQSIRPRWSGSGWCRHGYKSQLHQRLGEVESIDISKLPTDRVAYGSKVVLCNIKKEEKVTYKLVTSEESDPENGLISTVSPIGQALMSRKATR